MKSSKLMWFGAVSFLVVAYALAGSADLQEQRAQESLYTEMVCDGYWPDYDNRKPDCEVYHEQR